jgi:putative PEP-CTERM system TPR-repeat lipoprotein
VIEPVVAADPRDAEAANLLASALARNGDAAGALVALQAVGDSQPLSSNSEMRMGAVQFANKNPAQAIAHFSKAVELDPESERANSLLVALLVNEKRYDEALQLALRFQQVSESEIAAQKLLAQVYLGAGNVAQATAVLEDIIGVQPGDKYANYALASLAEKYKRFDAAREYLEVVLSHHRDDLETLLRMARVSALSGQEKDMEKFLRRAVSTHPEGTTARLMLARYYLATGKASKATPLLLELADTEKRKPEAQQLLGLASMDQGEFEDARYYLQELARQQPNSAVAHYLLARAYAGLDQREPMRAQLEQSLKLDPNNDPARLALTSYWLVKGDYERASAALKEVEKRFPDRPDVLHLRGAIARGEGDQQQASELLARAFAASPHTKSMLSLAGQMWSAGDREGAIAVQKDWLQDNPEDVAAALALGIAYNKDGATGDAIKQFEYVLGIDPVNSAALNELAWLLRKEQPAKALEYARRANESSPDNAGITDTLAVVLFYNGELDQASRYIQRALDHMPRQPVFRYHQAMIDAAAGNKEKAAATLTEVLSEQTNSSEKADAVELLATLQ